MTISPKNNSPQFILASASPRRQYLLERFHYPFIVHPSLVDEHFTPSDPPAQIVQELAHRKAKDVAAQYGDAIILGADTIVVYDGVIIEKPRTKDEARAMLAKLSSDQHEVLTGVALIRTDASCKVIDELSFFETSRVTFGPLSESQIEAYVATGSPMDKAGAYGIQDDRGAFFVKGIEGDFYNIIGLPLYALHKKLTSFAPEVIQ